ncbi:hypothetical protein BC829DRAFT_415030 [Chytridium lagenaria]|nr:hypothetical protein BC829DRAFT_415030 [Chytridium lagenaria]
MTFVTGPVMGKDDEPSLAEEIAFGVGGCCGGYGKCDFVGDCEEFCGCAQGGSAVAGDGSEGMGFKGAMSMASANSRDGMEVLHLVDLERHVVEMLCMIFGGPTEICPCGRHLAEGMRVFKLRKEVVAWPTPSPPCTACICHVTFTSWRCDGCWKYDGWVWGGVDWTAGGGVAV